MAATQNQADPDGADGSLDRLEAALETIARGLQAPRPAAAPGGSPGLGDIEDRIDAAIEHVKIALGRSSEQ